MKDHSYIGGLGASLLDYTICIKMHFSILVLKREHFPYSTLSIFKYICNLGNKKASGVGEKGIGGEGEFSNWTVEECPVLSYV